MGIIGVLSTVCTYDAKEVNLEAFTDVETVGFVNGLPTISFGVRVEVTSERYADEANVCSVGVDLKVVTFSPITIFEFCCHIVGAVDGARKVNGSIDCIIQFNYQVKHVYTCTCVHVCTCVCVHMHMCACVYMYMCECVHV